MMIPRNAEQEKRNRDHDALVLGLIFVWILSFALYGPLASLILESRAVVMCHVFAASHGLGLVVLGILKIAENPRNINVACGLIILVSTILVSFVSQPVLLVLCFSIMGLAAAFLVLSFVPRLVGVKDTVLTLGLAMALANLGLSLVQTFQRLSIYEARVIAAASGLMPLLAVFIMGEEPVPEKQVSGFRGQIRFWHFVIMGACAYLCGGVWYRLLGPAFFSHFAHLAGLDSLVYAVSVISLALYFNRRNIEDMGAVALCILGLSFCLVLAFGRESEAFLGSILFLNMGLASLDLFYWSVLSRFAESIESRKVFGVGLGVSLFSLFGGGILLERVTGAGEPEFIRGMASLGLLVLLVIMLLFVRVRSENKESEQKDETEYQGAEAETKQELDLTPSEKRVYDLLIQGYSDTRIAEELLISRNTVKFHVRNILRKAGAANRKELLALRLKRDAEPR